MRVLFFLEPLVMHSRPFHYWAWLSQFAEMARGLAEVGAEVRLVTNHALAERALAPRLLTDPQVRRGHALDPAWVVALDQEPIRRLFGRSNVAIIEALYRGTCPPDALAAYGALVRDALGGFVPDTTFSVLPAAQLAAAFPDALTVFTETAPFSRPPYDPACFLDPTGAWERSIPVARAAELFAREASPRELELLATFRRRFGAYLAARSPFESLEHELRERARRVAFLPLQFGGEPGFDVNSPFRNQGEYLFHVLEELPPDTGVLVVEHPTAYWVGDIIDDETRAFVARRWPLVRFVDFRRADAAGQMLLQHADFTICVSSSLGVQSVFYGKPLVTVGRGALPFASHHGLADLPSELPLHPRLDHALAWMLTRYAVPIAFPRRGGWLIDWIERARAARRAGASPVDAIAPVASEDELAPYLFKNLDRLTPLRGVVPNGALDVWSRGPGPFSAGRETADGWHLLDFSGGIVEARRAPSGAGVVVRRLRAGTGITFFLSRIPDAASCAGSLARLRFRARSEDAARIVVYLYVQVDDGAPCFGTQAEPFVLDAAWRDGVHIAAIPALDGRTPGPGSHVEVVFALPPEVGEVSFELAEVRLEAVGE